MSDVQKTVDNVLSEFMYDPETKKKGAKSSGALPDTKLEYGNDMVQTSDILSMMFHALHHLQKMPDVMDILFTLVFSTQQVGFFGKIEIDGEKANTAEGVLRYEDIQDASGNTKKFLNKIHDRLKKYSFLGICTHIRYDGKGHANVILFYRDERKNIYVGIYEPHGSIVKSATHWKHKTITKAVKSITSGYNKLYGAHSMVYTGREMVSCPIGMQSLVGKFSQKGYCHVFSYLWLYTLMRVLSKIKKNGKYPQNTMVIIESVERMIITSELMKNNPKRNLPIILTNFGFWCVNTSIECYAMVYGSFPLLMHEKLAHFAPDTRQILKEKYKNVAIGQKCQHNMDCYSGICYNGKCIDDKYALEHPEIFKKYKPVPPVAPYKSGKKKGEKCLIHEDCSSGNCIQGKDIEDYGKCA